MNSWTRTTVADMEHYRRVELLRKGMGHLPRYPWWDHKLARRINHYRAALARGGA